MPGLFSKFSRKIKSSWQRERRNAESQSPQGAADFSSQVPIGDRNKHRQSTPVTSQAAYGNSHVSVPAAIPGSSKAHVHNPEKKRENVPNGSPLDSRELVREKPQYDLPVTTASDSLRASKKRRGDEIDRPGKAKERELETKKLNHYSNIHIGLQNDYQTLEGKISLLEHENQNLKEQIPEFREAIQTLEGRISLLEHENQNLKEQIPEYREAIRNSESNLKAIQQQKLELETRLQKKDEQIAACTKDIARLSNERPDSSRDDHYFETALSVLLRSIQSWVLGCYRNMEIPADFPDVNIPSRMHDRLSRRLGNGWFALMRNNPLELLQSYIFMEILVCIFTPFLFGVAEGYQNLFSIIESSAATEEATKWRMSTVNLILRRKDFQEVTSTTAHNLATEIIETLQALIANLSIPHKPASTARTRKLKALIDQATKLAVEFQQEPSIFSFNYFAAGTHCNESHMSDAKCGREDKEMADSGSRVIITVYPAVVRNACVTGEEVVILKAKVLASPPPEPSEEAAA